MSFTSMKQMKMVTDDRDITNENLDESTGNTQANTTMIVLLIS